MDIKTLLNYLTDFPGFIFSNAKLDRDHDEIHVQVESRKIVNLFVHNVGNRAAPMIILNKDVFSSRPFGVFLSFYYI